MTMTQSSRSTELEDRFSTEAAFRSVAWDGNARGYIPAEPPKYGQSGFPAIWWYDAERAAKSKRS